VVVEPDGRGAGADELEIQVRRAAEDVAEQPAVAVDLVEPRVGLDPDGGARRDPPSQERPRLRAVALALLDLGRIDLDEADVLAVRQHDRVAVDHVRDSGELRIRARGRCGEREHKPQQDESAPHTDECRLRGGR
jgi:hypothetical protein